jgi:hypothetical protein
MKEVIAFLLPPAIAFCGTRLLRLLLGRDFESRFDMGLRWALGLAAGMLVFTQVALMGALAGINLAGPLAWLALVWGGVEIIIAIPPMAVRIQQFKFQMGHLWLLLLLPVVYFCWVFGRLSTLEGTLEFDANAFWVFKAKVLYLEQGGNLSHWMHQTGLAYAHWDYPMLVPCLYLLDYGAVGGVYEFVNKVWPFWMVVALCLGILSLAKVWQRPHPLPILSVVALCFLPATLHFIRQEGGTIPMLFFVSLTAMLAVKAIYQADEVYLTAAMITGLGAAMSKFEGVIYLAMWLCVLLPFCWKCGWLKKPILWQSAFACVVCALPYVWYRLENPVKHFESGWWHSGIAAPAATLHRFPQIWFLNVGGRIFNSDFFRWQPDSQGHLEWIGKWVGLESFNNDQLGILPCLLFILLAFTLRQKSNRIVTLSLSIAILGFFTFLAFSMACLPNVQNDLAQAIDYATSDTGGRYAYPFFTAWFLGLMVVWFESLVVQPAQMPLRVRFNKPNLTQGGRRSEALAMQMHIPKLNKM